MTALIQRDELPVRLLPAQLLSALAEVARRATRTTTGVLAD